MEIVCTHYVIVDTEDAGIYSGFRREMPQFEGFFDEDDFPAIAEQFDIAEDAVKERQKIIEVIEANIEAFVGEKRYTYNYSRDNFKIYFCETYEKVVEVFRNQIVLEEELVEYE